MWRMLTGRATDLKIELHEHEADEESGSAHWIARYTFSTGRPVVNDIQASFRFADGLIADHVDEFDFRTLGQAGARPERPPGRPAAAAAQEGAGESARPARRVQARGDRLQHLVETRPHTMRTCVRMRWDEQRVEKDLRLPGVGDGTVVRTFDAPEAMGINFHEVRARSALNHVPGGRYGFSWTINPYRGCTHACVFCFARRTHTYLDFDAGRDFEREIVVKVNVPELLRAELARPSWKRELVALGTNTDPYQWVESRYRMMPEILAALEEAETPVSVLTKSPLVMRDVEIFERMAQGACRSRSTSRCRPSTRRPGGRPSRTPPAPPPASTRSPSCAAAGSTPAS